MVHGSKAAFFVTVIANMQLHRGAPEESLIRLKNMIDTIHTYKVVEINCNAVL